ncbi:putative thioredoxin-like protein [Golovinomyces cichoracearum]|uniref:Putative thioredoxin-like protein n=1 Tax=Golovinomyces cichoracearum TaxID=62708 RepID=A0A420HZ20_9PEZI|nr:putative thioredoxin-like protein [Golovinomyces cichoracearum]
MFSKLTTKIALRKAGIPSSFAFPDTSSIFGSGTKDSSSTASGPRDPNAQSQFGNLIPNIQIPLALKSWQNPLPPPVEVAAPPVVGTRAPTCLQLNLPLKDGTRRPSIVVFLRHCGCPFAEKTFLDLRTLANKYPNISCVAVSHCSSKATEKWISSLGGAWAVQIIIDEEREVYAHWGLGVSTTYHLLNPWTQMAARRLGNEEGIWAREVDPSANRWVIGGAWCTNELGSIQWGGASVTADDLPKFSEAVSCLGIQQ